MAHVNLLPWRAERRKQREREFYMQLVAAFVVGLGVLLLWMFWMDQRIDNQNDRNAYLNTEIKQLDVRIAKIKDLEKVRDHLLARKKIIEQLQADRSQMVHLFDELVQTIPSSARLTGLKQNGDSMTLAGAAQSNASVAEYMRNIQASPWMGDVQLSGTEKGKADSRMPYTFGLKVALTRPTEEEIAAGKAPAVPAASSSSAAAAATVIVPLDNAAAAPVAPAAASSAATKATDATTAKPTSAPVTAGGTKS